MNDVYIYHLTLEGQMEETAINASSPQSIRVESCEAAGTRLRICTDQAGLIGLLRHLHGHGFVLLAVQRISSSAATKGE